jgi:hypothetical protein
MGKNLKFRVSTLGWKQMAVSDLQEIAMLKQSWTSLCLGIGLVVGINPWRAASALPSWSITHRQQLARDLTVSASQDFFKQGRDQFDREIKRLERGFLLQNQAILKIDPNAPMPELQDWKPLRAKPPASVPRSQTAPTRSP